MNIDDKISRVIASCRTVEQLTCAKRYVKLAKKSNLIGDKKYYFSFGVITALKGMIKGKECK